MTEKEWERTTHLWEMWRAVSASRKKGAVQIRNRKFRLFACAFCRAGWELLTDERSRRAVEVAELAADGKASAAELATAKMQAWRAYCDGVRRRRDEGKDRRESNRALADHAAGWVANKNPKEVAEKAASAFGWVLASGIPPKGMWNGQNLVREVFANPFRTISLDPACLTPTVVNLAQAAYDDRTLPEGELNRDRLAVLADALEDAGCSDGAILAHLRGPGRHVRGCWPLDLILGREQMR